MPYENLSKSEQRVVRRIMASHEHELTDFDDYMATFSEKLTNIPREFFAKQLTDRTFQSYLYNIKTVANEERLKRVTTKGKTRPKINRWERYGKNGSVSNCAHEASVRYRSDPKSKVTLARNKESNRERYWDLKANPVLWAAHQERQRAYKKNRAKLIKEGKWIVKKHKPKNLDPKKEDGVIAGDEGEGEEVYNRESEAKAKAQSDK